MRIVFLHGLMGSPESTKARWLAANFNAFTPDLDTRVARSDLRALSVVDEDSTFEDREEARRLAFETPLSRARAALKSHSPDVVVGSSFGGAVLLHLLWEGAWEGPCVFLASADSKFTPYKGLPEKTPAIYIHGTQDEVVTVVDSRNRVPEETELLRFVEVEDGHRLSSILEDGTLTSALKWAVGSGF